jgi:hypothetical protein
MLMSWRYPQMLWVLTRFSAKIYRGATALRVRRIVDATKSALPSAGDLHQFKTKARFLRLY